MKILTKYLKKNIPDIRPGDKIAVHYKIADDNPTSPQKGLRGTGKARTQIFEGIVLKRQHGKEIGATFTVRKISFSIGVEKTFPLHSPNIVKIEKKKSAQVRRAKLYYLRDLVGKKATKLKREKKADEVWEEMAVPEEEKIENGKVENRK